MRTSSPRVTQLTLALPHVLLGGVLAFGLLLAEYDSRHFQRLMQEDGWAEWATFGAFALAAWLALGQVPRTTAKSERLVLLGLGLFCVFVAGEEISWGQRLIGYRPPALFLEHNFQQEANLHNLLKDVLDSRHIVMLVALSYGVLAPLLAFVLLWPHLLSPKLALVPYFAFVAWLELSYPYELTGELAELVLGLAFLCDVSERSAETPISAARRAALGQSVALWSALVLVPVNDGIVQLHAAKFTESARAELAHLAAHVEQATTLKPDLFRKRHVHKRVYTAARAGYLQLPKGEYALDPWNNPYWIVFVRGGEGAGEMLLYSFGPNHRRESDIDSFAGAPFSFAGDDVGVVLQVKNPARAER